MNLWLSNVFISAKFVSVVQPLLFKLYKIKSSFLAVKPPVRNL